MKWTEALVLDAIRASYVPERNDLVQEEWAMLTQVLLRGHTGTDRTIDALLVRNWSSKQGHERIAIEVKVSRADYRSETPEKRAPAEVSAHRCAYAAPAGLIEPTTLPDGWGLIEVYQRDGIPSRTVWRTPAARREPTCDLDYLVSAGVRRASRAEERIRRGEGLGAEVARLQADNTRLSAMVRTARAAAKREEMRAKAARSELLACDGMQECADCGGRLTWRRGGQNDMTWGHVDQRQDDTCSALRSEADRQRREREHGTKYGWGFAGPVEPRALREAMQRDSEEVEAV
jgi:hypothetical protein